MEKSAGLNIEKVITLVGEGRAALARLSQYSDKDEEELLSSEERMGNIRYQFIVAIEACMDLCNHIVARQLQTAPDSYAQCFELLGQRHIIPVELAKRMSDFAKFRNVLVHLYWKVDDRRVIQTLKEDLPAIDEFLREISRFADKEQS
jgi:uncharacterized protein YutE (UPF0331/DUF86 family)